MFCPSCGTKLDDGSKFCGSCGARIESSEGAGPAATVASPSKWFRSFFLVDIFSNWFREFPKLWAEFSHAFSKAREEASKRPPAVASNRRSSASSGEMGLFDALKMGFDLLGGGKNARVIGSAVELNGRVDVYDEKGSLMFTRLSGKGSQDGLKGYTSSRVNVRVGSVVYTYDSRGMTVGTRVVG